MKIAFIRPHLFDTRSADALEPLAFAVLAGATPPDVHLRLHDERLAPIPLDEPADLVGITVETYTARRSYQIADHYRGRGIPVVMGGYHPSFLPEEAALHADAVVVGDADSIWPHVVGDAREGRLQPRYRADAQPSLDGVRYDRSIFHGLRYPRVASVQVSRGCRYACDFCSIHAFYGSRVRQRPPHEVAAEIAAIQRRRVLIVDDNLFTDRAHAAELFRALIPLKIQWGCQITVDVADDDALLRLMARSGCVAALVGFESLDGDNLRQMNKAWMLRRQSTQTAVKRLHDHGIMVYGSFIFGYDHDTPDTIRRTVDFALDAKLFLANISVLTPMPGSRLYQRLQSERRLLFERWWLDPQYSYGDVTYRPARMTAEALHDGCREARGAFYQVGAIARRLTNVRANAHSASHLGLFLAANVVSRRELASKIGRPLGATSVARTPHSRSVVMTIGRLALVLVLAAIASPVQSAQAPETPAAAAPAADEAEHAALRQLKTVYERAISENNIDALAPYFSDQFHGVMLTGRVVTNFDELKRFWADMRELIGEGGSYTTTLNPERSVVSGDVALARGNSNDVVVTSEKDEFRFTSYWTAVLQKQAGQWKLVQVQGTIDPIDNPFVREFNRRENRIVIPLSAIGGVVLGLIAGWLIRRRRA